MMKNLFYLILFIFSIQITFGQYTVKGKIKSGDNGSLIEAVHVSLNELHTLTDASGYFEFKEVKQGKYTINISHLSFKPYQKELEIKGNQNLTIELKPSTLNISEVVISGTRNDARTTEVPSRINTLNKIQLQAVANQSADEILAVIPGVNVSRQFGIFSTKSSVTMRGVAGNEQARILVMEDGIPLNKSDGGSVNWNLINTETLERIEVVKGPGSSLYGGNAMGGSINMITGVPSEKLEGKVYIQYSTYNTKQIKGTINGLINPGKKLRYYWGINGFKRNSDGYITQSEGDQKANPYIVPSTVNDWAAGAKAGVIINGNQKVEFSLTRFDDMRGTGEVVFQENGNTTEHDSWFSKMKYSGSVNNLSWNVGLFYYTEDYKKVNEFLKDDYTLYKVLSVRQDKGLFSSFTYKLKHNHTLTSGIDYKNGSVDASDVYYTSTDIVNNAGSIHNLGVYLQDEYSILNNKIKIVGGIRYDYSLFYDGLFSIEHPTSETTFMTQYQISYNEKNPWMAWSPRLAAYYKVDSTLRVFANISRGFRSSVLDDLCRSGRIRGGFKIANPNLDPEYITGFELGAEKQLGKKIEVKATGYYTIGTNYHYYVNSGDSIDMGFGLRPIFIRQNIDATSSTGFETEIQWQVFSSIKLHASYALNVSKIDQYEPLSLQDTINLTGKFIVDVPTHLASVFITWSHKNTRASIIAKYTGSRFVNDLNAYDDLVLSDKYPAYTTIDISLNQTFYKYYFAGLEVQNILDQKFYDSKGAVCPGRFISGIIGIKF